MIETVRKLGESPSREDAEEWFGYKSRITENVLYAVYAFHYARE